jgi:hypothetical protein
MTSRSTIHFLAKKLANAVPNRDATAVRKLVRLIIALGEDQVMALWDEAVKSEPPVEVGDLVTLLDRRLGRLGRDVSVEKARLIKLFVEQSQALPQPISPELASKSGPKFIEALCWERGAEAAQAMFDAFEADIRKRSDRRYRLK